MLRWFLLPLVLTGLCLQCMAQTGNFTTQQKDSLAKVAELQRQENIKTAAATQFNYFVIKADNNTFGYDVYADGSLFIHQSTIPGLAGTNGFADTTIAGKTAQLVIAKIKKGELPPVITSADLQELGLLNTSKQQVLIGSNNFTVTTFINARGVLGVLLFHSILLHSPLNFIA